MEMEEEQGVCQPEDESVHTEQQRYPVIGWCEVMVFTVLAVV